MKMLWLACLAVMVPAQASAAAVDDLRFGCVAMSVSDSWTAQVFHVVDQLSEWDQFTHKHYVRWAARALPLDESDRRALQEHAVLRRTRGWGHGFEQAFYVDDPIELAAQHAVEANLLTAEEAAAEKEILLHFAGKLVALKRPHDLQLGAFERRLQAQAQQISPLVQRLCQFAEVTGSVAVPVSLVLNPEEGSGGGGANGGRVVVEVQSYPDPLPSLLHESLHALIDPHRPEVTAAAESAGISWQVLNEGIAYAFAPGLTDPINDSDWLAESLTQKLATGASGSDSFVQFYLVATVIRPLLRSALEHHEPLSAFLPRAAAKLRSLRP